jgi:dTDP-4-dehydrorhamnose 3,5-epimerase
MIDGVLQITPFRRNDERGYFCEVYSREQLAGLGIRVDFVQDNESLSKRVGTVRGLHLQVPPSAQGKLVRVINGAVLDVLVDLRSGSPTFGDHVAIRLDSQSGTQVWIPPGFAHGFCTLVPDTLLAYKVTHGYDPTAERSLRWDDPDLAIDWPVKAEHVTLSTSDRAAPSLAELGELPRLFV